MSQKLQVLLSMFILIAVAEGNIKLCPGAKKPASAAKNASLANFRMSKEFYESARRAEAPSQRANNNADETWNDRILRRALILDDQSELKENRFRRDSEDSTLTDLLRAAELQHQVLKRNAEVAEKHNVDEGQVDLEEDLFINYESFD